MSESVEELRRRVAQLERVARAAQMHRAAMTPQEDLDTGWALDEALRKAGFDALTGDPTQE